MNRIMILLLGVILIYLVTSGKIETVWSSLTASKSTEPTDTAQ